MIKALALHLTSIKNKYYEVSAWTGATKVDSWIDIEGGIGNLFANASLRRQFPDLPYNVDGVAAPLSKTEPLLVITLWFQEKGLPFTSMHLIFQYGECLKKLRLI